MELDSVGGWDDSTMFTVTGWGVTSVSFTGRHSFYEHDLFRKKIARLKFLANFKEKIKKYVIMIFTNTMIQKFSYLIIINSMDTGDTGLAWDQIFNFRNNFRYSTTIITYKMFVIIRNSITRKINSVRSNGFQLIFVTNNSMPLFRTHLSPYK